MGASAFEQTRAVPDGAAFFSHARDLARCAHFAHLCQRTEQSAALIKRSPLDLAGAGYEFDNAGYGMRAIGFHGTSVEAAQRILALGFRISRNDYDWLGDGAYFFQDAPARALEWARKRFGDQGAVVGAEIDRTDGIDLLDVRWHPAVSDAYARYRAVLVRQGTPLPRQTRGAHRRDRAGLNYLAARLEEAGRPVKSIRAHSRMASRCFRIRRCSTGHTFR